METFLTVAVPCFVFCLIVALITGGYMLLKKLFSKAVDPVKGEPSKAAKSQPVMPNPDWQWKFDPATGIMSAIEPEPITEPEPVKPSIDIMDLVKRTLDLKSAYITHSPLDKDTIESNVKTLLDIALTTPKA